MTRRAKRARPVPSKAAGLSGADVRERAFEGLQLCQLSNFRICTVLGEQEIELAQDLTSPVFQASETMWCLEISFRRCYVCFQFRPRNRGPRGRRRKLTPMNGQTPDLKTWLSAGGSVSAHRGVQFGTGPDQAVGVRRSSIG